VFECIASMGLYHSSDRLYCLLYDMYNFNPLGLELNWPYGLHLYILVHDLVKAMDKVKRNEYILLQIVDIWTL
jgi:hypothetical protein